MQLYQHQTDFLEWPRRHKTALVWSCGTGKTLTAIMWAKQAPHLATVIVCPKALKQNWLNETERMALSNAIVVTKEEFKKTKFASSMSQIIVDEVHNGFLTPLFKSQMSKALRAFCKNAPRVLLLSATIYTSSPWNIYNLATYVGLDWNYRKFSDAFFTQVRMGRRIIPVAKAGAKDRLAVSVKKFCSIVDIADCIDVPPQVHTEPEVFKLNKEQISAIKDAYDPLPIVRYTKQHEIEQGILIGDEFTSLQTFPADKNERIVSLVRENNKIAIVCRYNAQIDLINALLKKEGYSPLIIRGDVKDRHAVTLKAESSKECIVLIQADCAEGYQLPSFPVCVFASQSYSYVKFEQICGRFLRMDKPSKTTFIYLLTEGKSIDRGVYDSVKRKEDFNLEVYGKIRGNGQEGSAI